MKKGLFALLFCTTLGCDPEVTNTEPRELVELPPLLCDGDGCTYTQGWYKNHDDWPVSQQTMLCGDTLENWLDTPPQGDAWIILTHQWITAWMNGLNGAAVSPEVYDALEQGYVYVLACEVSDDDKADAIAISEILDAFNNGLKSAPHCDDVEEFPTHR